MSYLPCELHCHTIHSDGDFQVRELLMSAKEDHLALIALTDHNTFSGWSELDDSILPAVRGIEWTTFYGHMLVLGGKKFVDWRDARIDNIDQKINEVRAGGGIVGVAHPFQIGSPLCTGGRWEFNVKNWNNVDYMEIWHENFQNGSSENEKALKLWTSLLDRGYKIAAVYGKDWHRPTASGHYGCTYIDFDSVVDGDSAIRGIRMGKTVASTGAKFFFELYKGGRAYTIGDTVKKGTYTFSFFTDLHSRQKNTGTETVNFKTIKIVTNKGATVLETRCDQRNVRLSLEKGHWYRGELWGSIDGRDCPLAVTSPVYCE